MNLRAEPVEGTEPRSPREGSEHPEELRATLTEHIDELRHRLMRSLMIVTAGWAVGWFLQPKVYAFLNELVVRNIRAAAPAGTSYQEAFRHVPDVFLLKLKLSLMIGIVIAFPFVVLQLWGFVRPGLKPSERKPIERLAPLSVFLFALGAFFCWLVLPAAIRWFAGFLGEFPGTNVIQEPGTMVFFILKMVLAFGIGFQLPVVVYALGALGFLSAQTMLHYWRQVALVIFMLCAAITPSADAFTMLMMAIPLLLLFFISAFAVKLTQSKRSLESYGPEPIE